MDRDQGVAEPSEAATLLAMQAGSWFDRKDLTLPQRENEVARMIDAALDRRTAARKGRVPLWRHKKRGSVVRELGRGFAQVSVHPIEEMTAVVIYEHDGQLWVRNAVEFDDGRFEPVAAAIRSAP